MTTIAEPFTSTPPLAVSTAPQPVSGTADKRTAATLRLLAVVALAGGAVLAGIGFTGSYSALTRLGFDHGFGWFAHVFPIGLDAGIVVLLALDLLLIRRDTPWPVLRLLAHTFTAATIVFNASSTGRPILSDPIGAGMHGVIPLMFIAAVEAGRRLVIRMTDIAAGREHSGVPLHRWLLAPFPSWKLYRRMRLWDIPSYPQAVRLERDRLVYRVMLDRKYGDASEAPSDALLPLTMAKYGLSVEEALALPQEAEEAERLRAEQAQTRAEDAETRAMQRAADREKARLRAAGGVEAVRHEVDATTGVAAAQTRGTLAQADAEADSQARAATATAAAEESAEAAAARRREAEDNKAAAEARKAAAETERRAVETENAAAETRRRTAESNRTAAIAERDTEAAAADAESLRQRTAEARKAAAEAELRALETEDAAKLTPRERATRKVARLILAAGGAPEAVELSEIEGVLGVSAATASARRADAAGLLASGYRPAA